MLAGLTASAKGCPDVSDSVNGTRTRAVAAHTIAAYDAVRTAR